MNKRGIVFTRPRDTVSFLVGLVLLLVGGIPVLSSMKLLPFGLPSFLTGLVGNIAIWLVAFGGAYVVIDGFIEPPMHSLHWFLIVAGLILLVVGLIPILNKFGVISFNIPFLANLVVYQVIIAIEGLLLVIGGFTEH